MNASTVHLRHQIATSESHRYYHDWNTTDSPTWHRTQPPHVATEMRHRVALAWWLKS